MLFEGVFDLALHPSNHVIATGAGFGQRFAQHSVTPGVQEAKAQLLQFAVGVVQSQSVGNGSVNLERFAADPPPFAGRHITHGAHIVGAVGQLDQDDPHILGHGQEHFSKRFGLVLLTAVELEFFQLGQPVDKFGNGGAKSGDQFIFGDATVFHHIVHERRHDGLCVKTPFGALRGHCNGVCDVRIAVLSHLAQMGFIGQFVGLAHQLSVSRAQVLQFAQQCGKAGGSRTPAGGGFR